MIYNVLSISAVQQSDPVIHTHIYVYIHTHSFSHLFWNAQSGKTVNFKFDDGNTDTPAPTDQYGIAKATFNYKCTDFYAPEYDGGVMWDDKDINIEWPMEGIENIILSEKDKEHPSFKELDLSSYEAFK